MNLVRILNETNAAIVLTTTHRINYSVQRWIELFKTRGITVTSISKINNIAVLKEMADRATEIKQWINNQTNNEKFVIIDDDLSINSLAPEIKNRCVLTKPLIGLDEEATIKTLAILHSQ